MLVEGYGLQAVSQWAIQDSDTCNKGERLNHLNLVFASVFHTGRSGPLCTCHFAAVRNPYGAEAVVGNSCDLASAPCSVMVVVVRVRVRHGVRVIGVQVVTTLWTLDNGKTVVELYRN